MQVKTVDTVVTNEEHVRLQIFDGDLNVDDAAKRLIEIERKQHDATRRQMGEWISRAYKAEAALAATKRPVGA